MKAMNLTVRETELFKLMVLCTTAGEWDKATCHTHGLIPIHQNQLQKATILNIKAIMYMFHNLNCTDARSVSLSIILEFKF
jgi:hypothetical protein